MSLEKRGPEVSIQGMMMLAVIIENEGNGS